MEVTKDTPFEFGYVAWPLRPGRHSMVVAVKATFAIVPGGACAIAETQVLVSGEVPFDDDEEASIRTDTDLALHKPHGECFVAGTFHAPGGRSVTMSAYSFRIGQVSKRVAVVGDRSWNRVLGMSDPEKFTSMQLRYERAFGGPGYARNPVGRGIANVETPAGPRRMLPNLEDPRSPVTSPDDRPEPAGSFPIARSWKPRTDRVGTYDSRWFKTRWPYLPDDFDWTYFNAAPADQQIQGYWRGDEEIQLQNLHPEQPNVTSRLPGLRARCFVVVGPSGATEFREIALRLDTIAVDGDAMEVSCVWRGATDVASPKLTDVERVFVMHEPTGAPASHAECRARMDAVLRAEQAEDRKFAPEPPEATATEFSFAETAHDAAAPAKESEPPEPDPRELLAAAGIEVSEEPPPPPTREEIEAVKEMLRSVGQEVPPELDEVAVIDAPKVVPPLVERHEVPLRERVFAMHAAGESLEGMDLSGADLSALDLRGAKLSKAILARADLRGCRFDGAVLDGANLSESDLSHAVCFGSSMVGADLTGSRGEQANFDGAKLNGATLHRASFPRSAFRRATLAKAEMQGITLTGSAMEECVLDEADLSEANLEDVVMNGSSVVDATFDGVVADRVVMDDCNLTKLRATEQARFAEGKFRRVVAPGSRWVGGRLDKADFSHADLERADFSRASMVQTTLNGCRLRGAKFAGGVLVGASMLKSDVLAGLFEDADLSHADLRGSNFFGAEFWNARTEGTQTELCNLRRTKLEGRT